MEQGQSYRQILKATSLFGGVQVFRILISIVRSKFIALFIGPLGMGISSLLLSTVNVLSALTNLGLDRSGVKEISLVKEEEGAEATATAIGVLQKLVWVTAVAGTLIMAVASPILSYIAFGNYDYTWAVAGVSLALFFKQLTQGKLAILQGLRKLSGLAKANLLGNFIGLCITVPLYYFFRIDAIVPAIIIAGLISFAVTLYYTKVQNIPSRKMGVREAFLEGKPMINLGIMLSVSSIITLVVAYMIQVFISAQGGVDEVGLYNAGFVILNTYVGLVFTAMGTDYFPRLSAIANDRIKTNQTVHEQAFIAVMLILPIIVVFLGFAPHIITILYTQEFSPIIGLVSWGILGMLFKAVSFSMGYILIAKGDSRLFIKTAIGFNAVLFAMNVIGYSYGGLTGLGISFFLFYIVHFLVLWILTKRQYGFAFPTDFLPLFGISLVLCVAAFWTSQSMEGWQRYAVMGGLILISCLFSLYQLNKKVDLKEWIRRFRNRN